ncbi:phage tail tape measure C-terminal domain-containing protein [Brevundimonas sp.]|uniref:phage tail tape measure C-terminal domain-containing protein n=1 Tax=Brevundimonas sp. TaxID=1871086 RepID=UPI00391B57A2
MTDSMELDALPQQAAEAGEALEALREPAERAAASIEEAFGRAGEGMARSLARAAADGEVSLAELARAVLAAVNAASGAKIGIGRGSLGDVLAAAVGGLFGGSRADGGPVMPGAAYVVGERGPELFRPPGAGTIEPMGGAPGVTVNIRVDGGAQGLLRSEAQIAQALTRAVRLGARRAG